ncbi:PoNe immunity protein domain-containing protein [Granulicatella elegans]|uniref:PoNe immunity protein domain-containing protein n=1 Tax=Granulicatella elegans TaxID=137732 RepID=UPI0028D0D5BB|nr:PoNe immunity protein domain-containing protein [Granulicatella elegans]
MIRDKHKDHAYFEKWIAFVQKRLEKNIKITDEIAEEYLLFHYQDLVLNNEELVKLSYSIGASKEEIFPYYQSILSHLKVIASQGVPFYRAVDVFSLGVLYSERKEEFLDDLKAIYEQMDRTDGLIEYYMVYLFHDKIVPFHSILEYQNMIEDTYESVAKAQGFWYYSHSDAPWYNNHTKDTYKGYWSFDTAATCKIKGIFDERLKDLEYFPYDLLLQGE